MNKIEVVAAVIAHGGKYLATQRGYGAYKGWWEFPGGKMEPGESAEMALIREIKEELDATIRVDRFICTVDCDYTDFHLTMHCYLCHVVAGELKLLEAEDARWLDAAHLDAVNWLPADREVVEKLRQLFCLGKFFDAISLFVGFHLFDVWGWLFDVKWGFVGRQKKRTFAGMKSLAPYIEQLLLRSECVVVVGLGGFVRRAEHATYDVRTATYLPPRIVVSFNASLTVDDGSLVEQLMLAEGLSYQAARTTIEQWVEQIKTELKDTGRYELQGVGTLTLRRGEPISFVPQADACFAPALFAMPQLQVPRLHAPAAQRKMKAMPSQRTWHLPSWHGVAAVAAVVALFFMAATTSIDMPRHTVTAPTVATIMGGFVFGEHEQPLYQYNSALPQVEQTAQSIDVPKADQPAPTPQKQEERKQTASPRKPYTLVLASHVSKTGAQALVDQLKAAGLAHARVDEGSSMRRVTYAAYATRDEAQSALNELKQRTPLAEDAWVMHKP